MELFFLLLTVAFVTLKLTHKINWSWWWVLAPFWGPFLLVVVGAGLLLGGGFRP